MCVTKTDAPRKTLYFPPCSASLTRFPGNIKSFRGLFFGIALHLFPGCFVSGLLPGYEAQGFYQLQGRDWEECQGKAGSVHSCREYG